MQPVKLVSTFSTDGCWGTLAYSPSKYSSAEHGNWTTAVVWWWLPGGMHYDLELRYGIVGCVNTKYKWLSTTKREGDKVLYIYTNTTVRYMRILGMCRPCHSWYPWFLGGKPRNLVRACSARGTQPDILVKPPRENRILGLPFPTDAFFRIMWWLF